MLDITNIPPPRVPVIDEKTGLMSREWYRFLLSLFRLTGSGSNDITLQDLQLGPQAQVDFGDLNYAYDQAQLASLMTQYEQSIVDVTKELQTLPSDPQLGTLASQNADNVRLIGFSTNPSPAVPNPAPTGTLYWDGNSTLGLQMNQNVLAKIGQAQFVYVKASSAITKGQLCKHTGSVGASGVITAAPTSTSMTDAAQIIGVAAESIALNNFGFVQVTGDLRGFNTTGSSVGEVWADGDALYYNPAYVGSMTKVKPSAPNTKTYIGEVINAGSGSSGSINIHIVYGSSLGGTDNNVQFGTLSNNDLIQYDGTAQYWKNVSPSTISIGTATNLANGLAGSIPYQTAPSTTTFLSIGASNYVLTSTGTAPTWTANTGTGNVVRATSPTLVTPLLGTPTSGDFSTGTFTWPTFNQNTTGSAAKWTTARTLAGNSVDGSANVAFSNKFIVQGTTDTGLSGAQFLGALGTGLLKNTTTTGVLSLAVAATDYVAPSAYASTNGLTMATSRLLGRTTALSGAAEEISVAGGLTLTGGVLTGTSGTVTAVSVASANGFAGTSSGGATPALTLSTTITGVLKGNATAISAATAGTDYSAGTSALTTGILKSTTTTGALTIAVAADFPTLNQNTTGTAAGLSATLVATSGGTGQSTYTLGDTLYSSATNTLAKLAGNITSTRQFLRQTGTGTVSAAPAWDTVTKTDVGLSNVENTALSTWAGSTNITTLGTVATGTWSATTIAANKGGTGQTAYAIGDLLYADTASTIAKLADVATGNALISGGVGVAPSYGKIGLTTHVSGTLPVANGGTGTGTTFTTGSVLFAGASGVYSQNNAQFFWDNTNNRLGIGTAAPAAKLQVFGGIDTTFSPNVFNTRLTGDSSATSGNSGSGISFQGYTTGTTAISDLAFVSGIKENTTDTNYAGALVFGTRTNGSGSGNFERMRIASSGNVGIGASTPSQKLTLIGNQFIAGTNDNTFSPASITLTNNGLNGGLGGSPASLIAGIAGSAINTGVAYLDTARGGVGAVVPLAFKIDGTEWMRILSSGNVGIGTATPSTKLDVKNTTTGSAIRATVTDGAGSTDFGYGFYIDNTAHEIAAVNAVYTTSASGGSGALTFKYRNAGTLTEGMRLNQLGNVGIGNASPTVKLDVTGEAIISGRTSVSTGSFSGATLSSSIPAKFYAGLGLYTDTASAASSTNVLAPLSSFRSGSIAATNTAVTYTDAANVYISGPPLASTNVTFTNAYSLYINSGQFRFPGDTRKSIVTTYNDSTGDVYGMEQVSLAQSGTNAALRLFCSSAASSVIGFGKYTSATAFTEFARFDNNGQLGIGTTTPSALLEVANSTGVFNYVSTVATGSLNGPVYFGQKARGAVTAPTAVLSGDTLVYFSGGGYNGTNYTGSRGFMSVLASENWTGPANGADVAFSATPTGSTTASEKMRITGAGNVGIGTTTNLSTLTVNGSFASKSPSSVNAATYTVAATDGSLRFTTTNCTVTLPAAASFPGRILYLNTITANSVTSASSNVIPLGSNTAGTAILAATAGKFSMLQSDGTNWITMMAN